jgi:hypothetical protein
VINKAWLFFIQSITIGFKFFEARKNITSFPFHKQNVLNMLFALMSAFIEFFNKNGEGFGEESPNQGTHFWIFFLYGRYTEYQYNI